MARRRLPVDTAVDGCGAGGCDGLLAVAMSGWSGPAGGGPVILRRGGDGTWNEVAESSGPDWDVYDVSWGDCCGPAGPPQGVAGTTVAWSTFDFVVEDFEPVVVGGVVTGIFVVMNTAPEQGLIGQVIWLPNESAAGVFGFGAAEPVYQATVTGHGLAWIAVPPGVLP